MFDCTWAQQFEFSRLKTLLVHLVICGKFLHSNHHLWNGLVPLCPSYHWKHCIGARRLLCNQAKACPESRGIATVSLVWRISIVMSISSQTTQCTRSYSNLTRKRLIKAKFVVAVWRDNFFCEFVIFKLSAWKVLSYIKENIFVLSARDNKPPWFYGSLLLLILHGINSKIKICFGSSATALGILNWKGERRISFIIYLLFTYLPSQ